ncbi:hypothetical protein QE152_g914 [Popillia japonica]|uniref:Uncharacterized protein n=1 Tax=Popillia japonica TaxID=7064 RepID=A0AAW1N499_POPJA
MTSLIDTIFKFDSIKFCIVSSVPTICEKLDRAATKNTAEVEGYGPYKPVPPPKPLPQQPPSQPASCLTPPPYRMPPYPLYNEPSIPGATAGHETPVAASSSNTPQNLQTHSSKFPVSIPTNYTRT